MISVHQCPGCGDDVVVERESSVRGRHRMCPACQAKQRRHNKRPRLCFGCASPDAPHIVFAPRPDGGESTRKVHVCTACREILSDAAARVDAASKGEE